MFVEVLLAWSETDSACVSLQGAMLKPGNLSDQFCRVVKNKIDFQIAVFKLVCPDEV